MKPLTFTAANIPLLMSGQKTNTRRIMRVQPVGLIEKFLYTPDSPIAYWKDEKGQIFKPPHQPGDIVYAAEHLFNQDCFVAYKSDGLEFADSETHKAKVWPWKRSLLSNIFMPRWAARSWYKILDVRAERIQDISAEDVIAEGIDVVSKLPIIGPERSKEELQALALAIARKLMKDLWSYIHGKDAWDDNPWVWVYTLKRVEKPED